MKISALHGVITVHGCHKEARNIERAIYKSFRNINSMDSTQNEAPQPLDMPKGKTDLADQKETKCTPLKDVILDRKIIIITTISEEDELQLLNTLHKNKDIFTETASDLQGVSRDIIYHSFDIDPKMRPRKQRQRKMSKE
jgi:hypothetical protein